LKFQRIPTPGEQIETTGKMGQTIFINDKPYFIPAGWHEITMDKALSFIPDMDEVYQLTGIPVEVAETFPEYWQEIIAHSITVIKETYPQPLATKPDLGLMPFVCYVEMAQAINDPTKFTQTFYSYHKSGKKWRKGNCRYTHADTLLPRFWALREAWNEWHDLWPKFPIDEKLIRAGINQLDKVFGFYCWVYDLTGGDILKQEAVMWLETGDIFKHRAYKGALNAFDKKYYEIATEGK